MAGEAATPTSYIQHHLQNLIYPVREGGGTFWTIHVDTLVMAVLMGLVMVFAFWTATRNATAGVPGKWQAFVEICLEFVDRQAKDTYHGSSKLVTPIAITIFFWILLMNLIKMIPADFIAIPLGWAGIHAWKPVPTADVNATLGMSISVFFLMIVFSPPVCGKVPTRCGNPVWCDAATDDLCRLSRNLSHCYTFAARRGASALPTHSHVR